MNNCLNKLKLHSKNIYLKGLFWHTRQGRGTQILVAIAGCLALYGLIHSIGGDALQQSNSNTVLRHVKVSSITDLTNTSQGFPLVGIVSSASEATIRSESGGRLTRVYKKLGDTVVSGSVIAEFDNSGERAALMQAEGVYEQAKAAREIAVLNSGQSGSSLGDSKSQALNTIMAAYASMDDAIHGKTDSAFSDPKFQQVKLIIAVPDAILSTALEDKRRTIETLLVARDMRNKKLTAESDLVGETIIIQNELHKIKTYLDDLYTAYNKAVPDATFSSASLEAGKSNVQSARQAIAGSLSSIIAAKTALSASITASQVAGSNSEVKVGGSLASADAQVKQALGAYNAASSRLEKTIIRSPISGTLNSLSINTGDYIGAFTQIAVVSNNGALEVVSFVTEDDARRVAIGTPVTIDGTVSGVITRVASAIDPTTKKIEVRIGIKDIKSSLMNGQAVRIIVNDTKINTPIKKEQHSIVIPLSALKLTPRGATVFEVTSSSTVKAISVEVGAIFADKIQILKGLVGDEDIVVDARGLKDGTKVIVETQ